MNVYDEEEEILRALKFVDVDLPYSRTAIPGYYIVDTVIQGIGFVKWKIDLGANWHVVIARFLTSDDRNFQKKLLLFHDREKHQFNRCHAIYCDKNDELKNGGTYLGYKLHEILASLINHKLNNDEKSCVACAGKHPLQTHFIRLL